MKNQKTTDKKMYELLEAWARQHLLTRDVDVNITPYSTSYTAKTSKIGGRYEDINLFNEMLHGATSFLMWVRREGIKI